MLCNCAMLCMQHVVVVVVVVVFARYTASIDYAV